MVYNMKIIIFLFLLIFSMNTFSVEFDTEVETFKRWDVIKFKDVDGHRGLRALQLSRDLQQVLNFDIYEEDCNDMMVTINATLPKYHGLQGSIPQGKTNIRIDKNKTFTADIRLKADTGMTIAVYEISNVSDAKRFAEEIRKGDSISFELKSPLTKKVSFPLGGFEEAIQRMTQLCIQDVVDKLQNSKPVK